MLKSISSLYSLSLLLLLVFGLSGCSGTPTRHLVSDVAMIKAGDTNKEEVLRLMGDPDSKRKLNDTTEEWVYYEEDRSVMQDAPLVGGVFDANGYNMVTISFESEIVKTCRYRGHEDDEFDWQDDCTWQETDKRPISER